MASSAAAMLDEYIKSTLCNKPTKHQKRYSTSCSNQTRPIDSGDNLLSALRQSASILSSLNTPVSTHSTWPSVKAQNDVVLRRFNEELLLNALDDPKDVFSHLHLCTESEEDAFSDTQLDIPQLSNYSADLFNTIARQGQVRLNSSSGLPFMHRSIYSGNDRRSLALSRFLEEYEQGLSSTAVKQPHRLHCVLVDDGDEQEECHKEFEPNSDLMLSPQPPFGRRQNSPFEDDYLEDADDSNTLLSSSGNRFHRNRRHINLHND